MSIKGDLEQAKVEFCANQRKKMSNGNGNEDLDDDLPIDVDEEEEKSNFLILEISAICQFEWILTKSLPLNNL